MTADATAPGTTPRDADLDPAAIAEPSPAVVLARVGDAEFAIPVQFVREALRSPTVSRVPPGRLAVRGAFALRGTIVPLIDLGVLLFGTPVAATDAVLVVQPEGMDAPVALAVDAVIGMLDTGAARLRPPLPEAEIGLPEGWIAGMMVLDGDRPAAVLDLFRVLEARGAPEPVPLPVDSVQDTA